MVILVAACELVLKLTRLAAKRTDARPCQGNGHIVARPGQVIEHINRGVQRGGVELFGDLEVRSR